MTQSQQPILNKLIYLTGRISFPNIVDPQTQVDSKTGETKNSYNCDIIMPPNDPGFQNFMQTYATMAQEQWKENAQAAMQMIQSDRKTRCYGQGEEKVSKKTFQIHPGYAGNVFISARNNKQPQIIDTDGKPIDPTNTMQIRAVAARIEGGVIGNIVVRIWLQNSKEHGIGVRCDLVAIQFNSDDGTRFGAAAADVTGFFGAVAGAAPAAPSFAPAPAMPAAPFPQQFAPSAPQPQMTVPGGYLQPALGMPNFLS